MTSKASLAVVPLSKPSLEQENRRYTSVPSYHVVFATPTKDEAEGRSAQTRVNTFGPRAKMQITPLERRIHLSHVRLKIMGVFSVFGHPPPTQTEESGTQRLLPREGQLTRPLGSFSNSGSLGTGQLSSSLIKTPFLGLIPPPASGQKEISYARHVGW